MAWLRRDRNQPPDPNSQPWWYGSSGAPYQPPAPGSTGSGPQAYQWSDPAQQAYQWPAPPWPAPPEYGAGGAVPPQAPYQPGWPAVPTPPPPPDWDNPAIMTAADAGQAAAVLGGNGHVEMVPPEPVKVKVIERFQGPRLKHRMSFLRRLRSLVLLLVIGIVMAGVLSAVLALIVWAITTGVHAASTG